MAATLSFLVVVLSLRALACQPFGAGCMPSGCWPRRYEDPAKVGAEEVTIIVFTFSMSIPPPTAPVPVGEVSDTAGDPTSAGPVEVVPAFKVDAAPEAAAAPGAAPDAARHGRPPDVEAAFEALGMGDYERAATLLRGSLGRAEPAEAGELAGALATALNDLGVRAYNEGRHAESLAHLFEAETVLVRAGLSAVPVLENRAVVEMAMREYASAEVTLERAGATPRALELKARLLRLRARNRTVAGDARGATALLERAAALDPSGSSVAAEFAEARIRAD